MAKERSKEFVELLIKFYNETGSAYKTAKKIGSTPFIIYSILKENNIAIPSWKEEKPLRWKITGEKAKELVLDYQNGVQNDDLVIKYGVGKAAIKNTIKRHGVPLKDHGGQRRRVTDEEAKEVLNLYKKGVPQAGIASFMKCGATVVSRILISNGLFNGKKATAEKHGSWKGGLSKNGEGYILQKIYSDNLYFKMAGRSGYVLQHRYIMAQSIGRVLEKEESVHHINGNRLDNRLDNLQLRKGRHGKGIQMQCNCCGSYDIKTTEL